MGREREKFLIFITLFISDLTVFTEYIAYTKTSKHIIEKVKVKE